MILLVAYSIIFIGGLVVFAFECQKEYLKRTKLKNYIVAPCLPVFGNFFDLLQCDNVQIFDFPRQLMIKYGIDQNEKLMCTWVANILFMYTDHPDTMQQVFNSEVAFQKGYPYTFIRNTNGLITAKTSIWKLHRKVLNPTLGPKIVNTFIPIFNEKTSKMIKIMNRSIGKNIDLHPFAFKTSLESIFQAAFDVDWSMQNKKGDDFRTTILDMLERVQIRIHTVWMKLDPLYKLTNFNKMDNVAYQVFHRLVEGALETKKIDLADKMANGIDEIAMAKESYNMNYLQKCLQMEMEQKFDDKDVCEEMQTILLAGSETTANVISSIILMLAIHPEYQDRLVDELHSIFTDVDEPVTKEHISKLSLMDLVIKESMRLYPPAPYIAREATADYPLFDGVIPKGTQIIISLYNAHRSPRFWGENVNEFYPERFLPENCKDHHPYQYVPFSAGPRNCIGIRYAKTSLCVSLAYLLRSFKFTTDLKMSDVKIRTGLIMKFVNEDPIRLERREW